VDRQAVARLVALILPLGLDTFAVAAALGVAGLPILPVIVLIALQAFLLSQLGLRLGSRLSERLREGAERAAGLVLITLGLVLPAERVTAG
jgi:putative Mn2+ efflux pump MntP